MDYAGNVLDIDTPKSIQFEVGAINTTKVLQTNTNTILKGYDPSNVVLRMQVQAEGKLPNSETLTTFRHENW